MSEVHPHEDRSENRQVERDSQLSAMFDGEVSAAECELLARRLARDEALRGQWTRYALIGAALRAERGVALHDRVAWRVQSAVAQEPTYGDNTLDSGTSAVKPAAASAPRNAERADRWMRFARPVFGAGIAAGVAALSILWLQNYDGGEQAVLAENAVPASNTHIVLTPEPETLVAANRTPSAAREPVAASRDYVTPAPSGQTSIAPPARLANYVVAHSEYSGPLSRRLALSGLVGGETTTDTSIEPAAADQSTATPEKRVASDAP